MSVKDFEQYIRQGESSNQSKAARIHVEHGRQDLRNRSLRIHACETPASKVQDEPSEIEIKVRNEPIYSLGLQELAVVKAIEANDTATLDQLTAVFGKSRSTIRRIVEALKEKGVLDLEGARKTGRWVLKNC